MRILVTGAGGYIGSVLTELLLDAGHEVRALDRFFFGPTLAPLAARPGLTIVREDIRTCSATALEGIDAVLDLAAISNDPAGELDPARTHEINHQGRARIAQLARAAGVGRYVLASSCSVYGFQEGELTEESPTNPLTTYAAANLAAEHAVLPLAGPRFAVTVVRQATVYGASRRMRFDLAVNGMALGLHAHGFVPVGRDGMQWRPMVHVRDTSRAFLRVLEAAPSDVSGQIFNVGSDAQNVQILPLAERVAAAIGRPFRFEWFGQPDHRSYRVSFTKLWSVLGYETTRTPEDGAREIVAGLVDGTLAAHPETNTVAWYKTLLVWQERLDGLLLDGRLL